MEKVMCKFYKHRFSENWHVVITSKLYLSPNSQYYTRCLKNIIMNRFEAERIFGENYVKKGSVEISNDFKKIITSSS